MEHGDAKIRENGFGKFFVFDFYRFDFVPCHPRPFDPLRVYPRANDKHLSSVFYLLSNELIRRFAVSGRDNVCDDFLSSFRHLVKKRKIEVAVNGQGKGPGNRGSRHGEEMRGMVSRTIFEERGALFNTESVLFVYDRKR